MAVKASVLETLALATLPQSELLPKLAMLWRRQLETAYGHDQEELVSWVAGRWGALFPAGEEVSWARLLNDEIDRQQKIIDRKKKLRDSANYTQEELRKLPIRRARLLDQILGPPIKWVSSKWPNDGIYVCGTISLTFVAGIISTQAKLKDGDRHRLLVYLISTQAKLKDGGRHRLLVYREKDGKARAYWVAAHVNSISGALEWLKKPATVRAQKAGARVVFDGRRQLHRLIYPDGRVTRVRWRKVVEYC